MVKIGDVAFRKFHVIKHDGVLAFIFVIILHSNRTDDFTQDLLWIFYLSVKWFHETIETIEALNMNKYTWYFMDLIFPHFVDGIFPKQVVLFVPL